MSINQLQARIKEVRELKRMAKELAAEITTIEDEIKAHMTAENTEQLIIGEYEVRWTTVTSNRFDTTGFKATHKELYEQYIKESVSCRFSIA